MKPSRNEPHFEPHFEPMEEQERSSAKPRGVWGLADQGVVSAGNFASNLICARYLTLHDFGCFALLFDLMLLLNGFTAAAICYPLSVKGAGIRVAALRRYIAASIALTATCLIPLGGVILVVTAMMTHNHLAAVFAAIALIGWQLQETTRRGLLAQFRFSDAIWGDAISYPLQALVMLILGEMHLLTLETAFYAMGLTSLCGFMVQWIQIGIVRVRASTIFRTGVAFWRSGRWMVLSNLASIPTVQAISWVLALFAGMGVVAEYQAIVNLLRIANPIISGISGVIIPSAAHARRESGLQSAWESTVHHVIQGAALLLPYFLLLLIIPRQVLSLVYGHASPYVHDGNALRLYVAANIIFYFSQMLLTFLAAVEEQRAVFQAQCWTTVVTILISLPLTACFGLYGVIAGVAVSIAVRFTTAVVSFRLLNWSDPIVGPPIASLLSPPGVPTAA
jgi:O-antigen/teichoic acid export membrane protein